MLETHESEALGIEPEASEPKDNFECLVDGCDAVKGAYNSMWNHQRTKHSQKMLKGVNYQMTNKPSNGPKRKGGRKKGGPYKKLPAGLTYIEVPVVLRIPVMTGEIGIVPTK